MIKRIIGTAAAAAMLAVMLFAILGRGGYTSMISAPDAVETAAEAAPVATPEPEPVDFLTMPADTLQQTVVTDKVLP